VLGFNFAGVHGRVVQSPSEAREALKDALADSSIGILIITERIGDVLRDEVDAVMLERDLPIIVEIPDRHGPLPERRTLEDIIKRAIGVSV